SQSLSATHSCTPHRTYHTPSLSLTSCCPLATLLYFFSTNTATPPIYTLSLHDALPISRYRYDFGLYAWLQQQKNATAGPPGRQRARRGTGARRPGGCAARRRTAPI